MEKRFKQMLIGGIYGFGVMVTFVLLLVFSAHSEVVLFPDAMLPAQLWELASGWLALGFVPMLVASILFCRIFQVMKSPNRVRNAVCVFIPSAVCGCFLVFRIAVWVVGIFNTMSGMG